MPPWFQRDKLEKAQALAAKDSAAARPVSGEVRENAANTIGFERRVQSWIDEAIRDCEQNGGFDKLEGKGKPIEIPTGDPLNSVLKNAGYLPPWLELQHEIRDDIRALLRRHDPENETSAIQNELAAINKKIARYNTLVPTPVLQKGRLHADSIKRQAGTWE